MPECSAGICDVGERGLLLPLFGDWEQRLSKGVRGVFYLIGLAWCFMGVAIIADVFMGAIEKITSKRKRVLNPATGRFNTVMVWNATVANLTLMALGSSAPEILLSVIELFSNDLFSGDLGPSTIVGSAAFNLLCIIAVCVSAISHGELRQIKEMSVYSVTASFSVFAYMWLVIILLVFSPNIVEPWEGVTTFLFFPALIIIAFCADKGYFDMSSSQTVKETLVVITDDMSKEELAVMEADVRKQHGSTLSDAQVMKIIEHEHTAPKSRAQYRVGAIREMTGSRRVDIESGLQADPLYNVVPTIDACDDRKQLKQTAMIEFVTTTFTALENAALIKVPVRRVGDPSILMVCQYATREGLAKPGSDYIHVKGTLEFLPGETLKHIEVSIIDDASKEDDEEFYIDLLDAPDGPGDLTKDGNRTIEVWIIDDDEPGILSWAEESIDVSEGDEDKVVDLIVQRKGGGSGVVGCRYFTEDATAVHPADYLESSGTVEFASGQMKANLQVTIKARGRYESQELFRVILADATGGASFDPKTDGGAETCILSVTIKPDAEAKERIDRIMTNLKVNLHKVEIGSSNWKDQFRNAIFVNGGQEEDEAGGPPPNLRDYALHILTVPWKLLCAFIPPTDFVDGWACFCVALIVIGITTAFIGDLASLLGCVMDIPDEVTAITFVALGTSLPDTFASKTAATQDPYADASIGNVTGSNSVNVFLGLGLPWMFGSIYWVVAGSNPEWRSRYSQKDFISGNLEGAFVVEAGNLGFSVSVFSCCAMVCILLLYIRRRTYGGELGGPDMSKWLTSGFLVFLWFVYVGLSSWQVMKNQADC
mmetsp:Transcript_114728/g.256037  ORF Transcript_114728/g.256037 Transcript_114728/m.256037 type:complete len:824 (-) Transcript_114728:36-2507(-)